MSSEREMSKWLNSELLGVSEVIISIDGKEDHGVAGEVGSVMDTCQRKFNFCVNNCLNFLVDMWFFSQTKRIKWVIHVTWDKSWYRNTLAPHWKRWKAANLYQTTLWGSNYISSTNKSTAYAHIVTHFSRHFLWK